MASLQPTIQLKPELTLLVSLAYEADLPHRGILPEELFRPETIATALGIGEGSTFSVSLQRVPKKNPPIAHRVEGDGKVIETAGEDNRSKLPDWVIYKNPQIEFTAEGDAIPEHRHRLAAALLELLVLTHEPIIHHPFLPTLLGFTWSQNRYATDQRVPVPIVDWANLGSLADYQQNVGFLSLPQKKRLVWQTGSALAFLHQCGICHGDVKTENVLMHRSPDGGITAKLSDFGMSVVSQRGFFRFLPPGSVLWTAPEVRWASPSGVELDKADVFSYGLLVWRVYCNGHDPLSAFILNSELAVSSPPDRTGVTDTDSRLCRLSDQKLRETFDQQCLPAKAASLGWMAKVQELKAIDLDRFVSQPGKSSRVQPHTVIEATNYEAEAVTDLQYLATIFENALCTSPSKRDLENCLVELQKGESFQTPSITSRPIGHKNLRKLDSGASNMRSISWLAMRHLDPHVRDFLLSCRMRRATNIDPSDTTSNAINLGNAACLIGTMGTDLYDDVDGALKMLLFDAKRKDLEAGALLYRVYNAYSQDLPEGIDYVAMCQAGAIHGSVAALEDLRIIAGELMNGTRFTIQYRTCGVGANFFFNEECLHGWSFANFENLDWIRPVLSNARGAHQDIRVNKRGDNFLHAAVTMKIDWLYALVLDTYHFDVNMTNDEGETPLLCAIRSGSVIQAHDLLNKGADPCITSDRGESPLHWIISSTEFGYIKLINAIIAKGGLNTLTCWAQRCDYAAVRINSFHHYSERLCDGTPLHWAICRKKAYLIRLLSEKGAPLDFHGPRSQYNAIQLAAYLHEADILRLLIQKQAEDPSKLVGGSSAHQERKALGHSRNPVANGAFVIKAAIDGSDRYSLLVRHGDRAESFTRRTFGLLGREFYRIRPLRGIDGQGRTALHYAASGGYDQATKHLLTYFNVNHEVNQPYGVEQWTPICEAVRRNHRGIFKLLLSHGAQIDRHYSTPARPNTKQWSLLHIAARYNVDQTYTIPVELIEMGLRLNDEALPEETPESPLSIAIENDNFGLANMFRQVGAEINAKSKYLLGGGAELSHPVSILGRIVASNMRYSKDRLEYLLFPPEDIEKFPQADFMILPHLGINVLHWSLLHHLFDKSDRDFDIPTRIEIFRHLLEKYDQPEHLNATEAQHGNTVLHIAVHFKLLLVVRLLVEDPGGVDVKIRDLRGQTALDLAHSRYATVSKSKDSADIEEASSIRGIIDLLEEYQ